VDQFSFNGSPATASAERVSRVNSAPPDPEVSASRSRRVFTRAYKQRMVDEAETCRESGQIGALLRREGLYSSHLTTWRKQASPAVLRGRGRKPMDAALAEQMEVTRKLLSEQKRLKRRLAQAEAIIEIQKKVSELLGIPLNSPESDENG
jgi:transposase